MKSFTNTTEPNEHTEGATEAHLDAAVSAARDLWNAQFDATVIDPETGQPIPNPELLTDAQYVRRVMSKAFLSWAKSMGIYVPE